MACRVIDGLPLIFITDRWVLCDLAIRPQHPGDRVLTSACSLSNGQPHLDHLSSISVRISPLLSLFNVSVLTAQLSFKTPQEWNII